MVQHHICGLYYLVPHVPGTYPRVCERKYLPQVSLSVHARVVSSTSRTTLTQTFVNPSKDKEIPELRYTFPLYDGVSVVGFVCTINRDRVIRGVVKERAEARKTYDAAVARGETAGLFEQLPDASDVFTTTIGNVPAGAEIKVDITYLGELKHDAEVDGIRFTIPTSIAPRYGSYPGEMLKATSVDATSGISVVVDAEMPDGSQIKSVQSPSHPISVTIGNTSAGAASGAEMSLQKASATLSLGTAELSQDFVLHIVATNTVNPTAVLESHPTIPNHRALMATLVPKFNLPASKPEIVFLCDRSGSMGGGYKIPNMKAALHIFLKSIPLGVKFNICSFGSSHELLFKEGSRTYDASSLGKATEYVDKFDSNFGGTEIYQPMEDIFKKRFTDMDLEVFLLTDGEVWDQDRLFTMINKHIAESKGAIRVFTLGIGSDVSHALIEGVARAGNGFAQAVGDNEKMNSKVVRMLKASLTPHVKDYTLEVKYGYETAGSDHDFEIVEKVMDAMTIEVPQPKQDAAKKPISLFDASVDPDAEMVDASLDQSAGGKYSHVPPVAEPKLLQAPSEIPPLFPFNRTSVYLLMSPETSQQTPKSVVLRGTCRYGPLELEIPVTVLANKGETIHQLAARKAVKELEEGRGWLYHAKDANDELLKDKFQGLFSDMVEREAVRLGVTYQVGGKWCSFVAVDESKSEKAEEAEGAAVPPPPPPVYEEGSSYCSMSYGLFGGSAVPPSPAGLSESHAGGLSNLMALSAPPPPMAPSPASASPGQARKRSAMRLGPTRFLSASPPMAEMAYVADSSVAPGAASASSSTSVFEKARSFLGGSRGRGGPPKVSRGYDRYQRSVGDECYDSSPPRPSGSSIKKEISEALAQDASDAEELCMELSPSLTDIKLETIVALQTFTGSWQWDSGALLNTLGLNQAALSAGVSRLGDAFSVGTDLLATAVVLAFLEVHKAGEKEEWEMLAHKAKSWLAEELRTKGVGISADEYVDKVKGVIAGL